MATRYDRCIGRINQAAGRKLSDAQLEEVFARIHRAALDIKKGVKPADMGTRKQVQLGFGMQTAIEEIAAKAAADMKAEALLKQRQADLQVLKLGARTDAYQRMRQAGVAPLEAVRMLIARDYTGRVDVESLEQRVAGYTGEWRRRLESTWDALGNDFLGFFQNKAKLVNLIRELRGEESGDPLAKKGAKAFHEVAEEARQTFNRLGGQVGKLMDWGMPDHHSQEKVATAGRDAWIDYVMPKLARDRYTDDLGRQWDDDQMRGFLMAAWDTISSDGASDLEPGKFQASGKRANKHAEHREIHFKDAASLIDYWEAFGEKTAVEVLMGHMDTMARDVAFVDQFGPNPDMTYRSLRDTALQEAVMANRRQAKAIQGKFVGLDNLYEYAAGHHKPTYRPWLSKTADAIANLNVAGKLGGASIASFFGDKPMYEAVSHLNNVPAMQRWMSELSLLNPANKADRALLRQQGLMLENVRSGLQRFYEGLGQSSNITGKLANAIMRVSGMNAINDIRKGTFGLGAYAAIGNEIAAGRDFAKLPESDVRMLRTWGITEQDWGVWRLAELETLAGTDNVLTPEALGRVSPEAIVEKGLAPDVETAAAARQSAIVKLVGAVLTETDFAVVTPGWKERAQFYGGAQRGTVWGELTRSILQFKSFPWAMFQRGMDAIANQDTPVAKAGMTAYLIVSTTLAGAMLMQVREMLAGKNPRGMTDENWMKFWGSAFLQGGALGIYGDFLYSANQTRMGSGPIEALSGPTLGPLLELGLVHPLGAARAAMEGKESHALARMAQNVKGFVPGGNLWYTKTALDHIIWQNVLEQLSPGYLAAIRQRTAREYGQDFWWSPGELSPDRAPDLGKAVEQ